MNQITQIPARGIRLPDEHWNILKVVATNEDKSVHQVVTELIESHLAKHLGINPVNVSSKNEFKDGRKK